MPDLRRGSRVVPGAPVGAALPSGPEELVARSRSSEQITVECPGCGRCYSAWTHGAADVDFDPAIGDPGYLRGVCTTVCPHCGYADCLGGGTTAERELWHG
jgi:hypothetical protein